MQTPGTSLPSLTLREIRARAVVLPLRRPIVARIATIREWPAVLIDLVTEEGVVGRSYLEPYAPHAMKYLVEMLHDLETPLRARPVRSQVAPFRGLPGAFDDCRIGPRHGRLGRARPRGRSAALCPAGRIGRAGSGLQQQRPVAPVSRCAWRRSARAVRRGRVHRTEAATGAR